MIFNKTKGKVISHQEIVCRTFFSQLRGLMFCRKNNLVMVFPTERNISLHMWFVFFPIDVLVLDAKRKIVDIKKNFMPFTFWSSSKKGKYVVELVVPGEYHQGDVVSFSTA